MKKVSIVLIIVIGFAVISIGTYSILDTPKEEIKQEIKQGKEKVDTLEGKAIVEEVSEVETDQSKKIGGIEVELDVNVNSSQDQVLDVMHKMTHQKIKAEDKWGAVPMIKSSIEGIYDIVSQSDFEEKLALMEIVTRWKEGDFSKVDDDHNFFWGIQGGTLGKAFGIMDETEEKEFIIINFGEKFVTEVDIQ
ncbi:DUF6241 domain-containing protein [Bacillus sp. FSL K6-3431]|uniref:DUF6241 domain-containing protein n=1 Tax=Bacillus sp. FSL K6-3431 TaxID=2921500 RepID=UPI0030F97E48